ncbi:MAG: dipeptide epimerase [Actinomycetota bacterium]
MSELSLTLEAEARELALAKPFAIATKTYTTAYNVFVRLRYGGQVGIGEASPEDRSGESVDSVLAALRGLDLSRLNGPFDLEGIAALLPPGSARCALDIAAHDLAAKLAGVSLAEYLGVAGRTPSPTSVTIPIGSPEEMIAEARGFADFPVVKVKVGFPGDVDAVAGLREVFGGAIRIDANEGWSPDEAVAALRAMEPLDIELCEQPILRGNLDELRTVTQATSIPIFADEDVETSKDVALLAGRVDGVNLKLRKTGGIREAIRAVAVARSLGMSTMIGCDLVSGVSASAEAVVACFCDHCDIDGPLLLAEDPFPGVTYSKGLVTLPTGPGLGTRGDG